MEQVSDMTAEALGPRVGQHYDELDELYREIWGEHLHHGYWRDPQASVAEAVEALLDFLTQPLQLKSGDRVLDVGCGYGATLRYLQKQKSVSGVGFTLSERQKQYAEAAVPKGGSLQFIAQDWLSNELDSSAFDVLLSIESFSHMQDQNHFLNEAYRVLRPGGRMVICDWLWIEDASFLSQNFLKRPICREGHLSDLKTLDDYQAMITQAGFQVVDSSDLSLKVKKTWRVSCARLLKKAFSDLKLFQFLLDRTKGNRSFLLTPFRLLVAAELRQFCYGAIWARKI